MKRTNPKIVEEQMTTETRKKEDHGSAVGRRAKDTANTLRSVEADDDYIENYGKTGENPEKQRKRGTDTLR